MCIYLQIILILNFKMEQMFVILEASVYGYIPTVYVYIMCAYIFFCGISLFTYTYVYI